jgi:arylsulfatase A-like enzyme
VNPHDIVLFPAWLVNMPNLSEFPDLPSIPEPPTRREDLANKPSPQAAYRRSYFSAYGPADVIGGLYDGNEQQYRDLYYRLHAEVEPHLRAVLDTVLESADAGTLLVRTSDHGELLGAHGGLHQKWFTTYDEATRVPFFLARLGGGSGTVEAPTSHVDLVPTLLDAAGVDERATATRLSSRFSEVHPLPGRSLMPALAGGSLDGSRPVYVMTRDNMMEGDSGASGVARQMGLGQDPPPELRIEVAAHVPTNFEAIVLVVPPEVEGSAGHLWKLGRAFDDRSVWSEPGARQLDRTVDGQPSYRSEVLPDEWELYDLTSDPSESNNLAGRQETNELLGYLQAGLESERTRCVPVRHVPWPYVARAGDQQSQHGPLE